MRVGQQAGSGQGRGDMLPLTALCPSQVLPTMQTAPRGFQTAAAVAPAKCAHRAAQTLLLPEFHLA